MWKHDFNLDFYDTDASLIKPKSWRAETCHQVKLVNSVLESYQAPFIKRFTIWIYADKSAHSTITKWLEFAQSRQVERLDLNFNSMTKSEGRAVVLEDLVREMRPMKYLKALSLAAMKVSGQDISYFLKNCPLLRELNITKSSFTSNVHVSGNLEILLIRECTFRKFVIEISAPHLYEVVAHAKPGAVRFKNAPRLAIASLVIGSLRYSVPDFASTSLLRDGLPFMPNLTELDVVVSRQYVHHCLVPVTSITSACPLLQMFTFKATCKRKLKKELLGFSSIGL
ncbi:putative F-box/LRR-repeat protein At5g02700 [Salvia hispanica]|uniref:putative F-box/LRR-repeat protein At5g02700 n=1 Tax=Salvia hispanica TaxID=49212 RepID=UPI002009BDE2|nr:putative F-box/LRR-repeat protein At5g02700 [Salvia hispanica]